MTETTTELHTVSLDDLDILVAECRALLPADASADVKDAFDRLETAWRRATVEHARIEAAARAAGEGETYFANIWFFGRIEYYGARVTEITKHGQAAYRVEDPEYVFGGDPHAVHFHSAQSWFGEHRVTEQSARESWEKALRDAEERRKREETWQAEQAKRREQRALEAAQAGAGYGDHDEDGYDGRPF